MRYSSIGSPEGEWKTGPLGCRIDLDILQLGNKGPSPAQVKAAAELVNYILIYETRSSGFARDSRLKSPSFVGHQDRTRNFCEI